MQIKEELKKIIDIVVKTDNSLLSGVKRVFVGDPILLAQSDLPCIIIKDNNGVISSRGTLDNVSGNIQISLIVNIKDDYNNDNPELVKFVSKTDEMLVSYNENNQLNEDCIAGIIRKNPTINGTCNISENLQFTYPNQVRADQGFTYEPNVIFNFTNVIRRGKSN